MFCGSISASPRQTLAVSCPQNILPVSLGFSQYVLNIAILMLFDVGLYATFLSKNIMVLHGCFLRE